MSKNEKLYEYVVFKIKLRHFVNPDPEKNTTGTAQVSGIDGNSTSFV
jgi:hypothetical protein